MEVLSMAQLSYPVYYNTNPYPTQLPSYDSWADLPGSDMDRDS